MRLLVLLLSLLSQNWAYIPDNLKNHELFYVESEDMYVHYAKLKDWDVKQAQIWVGLGFGDGEKMTDKIHAFQCGIRSDGTPDFRQRLYEKNEPFGQNGMFIVAPKDGKCTFDKNRGILKMTLTRKQNTFKLDQFNNLFVGEGRYVEMFYMFLKHFKTPKHQDQDELLKKLKKPPKMWPSSSNRDKPGKLALAAFMTVIGTYMLL